ncbi:PREDICTED: uncharacterized protein LOC107190117 [Dufourea novaeangliae]|uniref:Uncharacterized protein n=1 Tax=Dufourea novaeangliae TaxID=178035 RepID=A0A154NYF5_DUFNO|nr:PREDICTED: uncharacterized protein LOC107190117 [Dufourea novaeangliae]KZC04653.1 hypothetical protein WN55_00729 [Dufourea novaeangliae]
MYGLYLFDVYISQLMLNKETYTDTGGSSLITKIVIINLPPMEVFEHSRSRKNDIHVFKFKGGQACHFSVLCEELVKIMKRLPLYIGVFRVNDEFPICSVRTYLSGCACDLNTLMIQNPKSFIFRGPFDLVDPGNSFAGQLGATITVTNMGRCMMAYYALVPDCFFFKTGPGEDEYKCNFKEKSNSSGQHRTMNLDADSPKSLVRGIVGVSPVAQYLARGSPPPQPPFEPLVDPRAARGRKKGKGKKGKKGKKK